jgi:hypothetical protein
MKHSKNIAAPKSPAVIQILFSRAPRRARGVGENKKAATPKVGIKEAAQKSAVDADDNKRHRTRDVVEITVLRDLFGPSIVPPHV